MNLAGTKSEQNIRTAFAGESQARSRYSFFAAKAREEGRDDIAELFDRMADNERQHAKVWYTLLAGSIGDSRANLESAAKTENEEWKSVYPAFAREARAEGFEDIAVLFERIASIESDHERRFMEAVLNLDGKNVRSVPSQNHSEPCYYCFFCGFASSEPLPVCPVCSAEKSFTRADSD